ncbi:MAG: hypothetical protein ACXVNM_13985 [Bacteroidia bacterium]
MDKNMWGGSRAENSFSRHEIFVRAESLAKPIKSKTQQKLFCWVYKKKWLRQESNP